MSFNWLRQNQTGIFGKAMVIGVLKTDKGVILIDSGIENASVKKTVKSLKDQKVLSEKGVVTHVINTHSHSDHIGGNGWLQSEFGTQVVTSAIERPYVERPHLEGHYLFSASPPVMLQSKFFNASESHGVNEVDFLVSKVGEGTPLLIDDRHLICYDFKGHSPGMMGIQEESGILFVGDLLFTQETLEKHKLLYGHNVIQWLNSLQLLKNISASGYVLSHGGFYENVETLIQQTENSLLDMQQRILKHLKEGQNEGQLHQTLSKELDLVETASSYYLNHSAIRAHLSALLEQHLIDCEVYQSDLVWKSANQF